MTDTAPTDQKLSIRFGTVNDAAALSELGARTFMESFADHPMNDADDLAAYVVETYQLERQEAELRDPATAYLIAESADRILGFAYLRRAAPGVPLLGDQPVQLARIYVDSAAQGRRIGATLLDHSIAEAQRAGLDVMWLGVWEHNPRAVEFYRRHGFTEAGDMTFMLGSDAQRDVIMQRLL